MHVRDIFVNIKIMSTKTPRSNGILYQPQRVGFTLSNIMMPVGNLFSDKLISGVVRLPPIPQINLPHFTPQQLLCIICITNQLVANAFFHSYTIHLSWTKGWLSIISGRRVRLYVCCQRYQRRHRVSVTEHINNLLWNRPYLKRLKYLQ